jgi:hypothetical protein
MSMSVITESMMHEVITGMLGHTIAPQEAIHPAVINNNRRVVWARLVRYWCENAGAATFAGAGIAVDLSNDDDIYNNRAQLDAILPQSLSGRYAGNGLLCVDIFCNQTCHETLEEDDSASDNHVVAWVDHTAADGDHQGLLPAGTVDVYLEMFRHNGSNHPNRVILCKPQAYRSMANVSAATNSTFTYIAGGTPHPRVFNQAILQLTQVNNAPSFSLDWGGISITGRVGAQININPATTDCCAYIPVLGQGVPYILDLGAGTHLLRQTTGLNPGIYVSAPSVLLSAACQVPFNQQCMALAKQVAQHSDCILYPLYSKLPTPLRGSFYSAMSAVYMDNCTVTPGGAHQIAAAIKIGPDAGTCTILQDQAGNDIVIVTGSYSSVDELFSLMIGQSRGNRQQSRQIQTITSIFAAISSRLNACRLLDSYAPKPTVEPRWLTNMRSMIY